MRPGQKAISESGSFRIFWLGRCHLAQGARCRRRLIQGTPVQYVRHGQRAFQAIRRRPRSGQLKREDTVERGSPAHLIDAAAGLADTCSADAEAAVTQGKAAAEV